MDERERWDARHREREAESDAPDPFVRGVLERLGPGIGRRALDLASGTGRHALELAARGWRASAWDISPEALRIVGERAARAELEIERRAVDLSAGELPRGQEPFDLVVLVNFLDRSLLARARELVREGGHLAFATFTQDRPGAHPRADFCLERRELSRGIGGFETLELREADGRAGILARRMPEEGAGGAGGAALHVRRFALDLWDDFLGLHSEVNGLGWCRCVAWWTATWDEFRGRTEEENLAHRRALCSGGEWDGYLAFEGDRAVGWCQVGPRDRLAKLAAQYRLEPDPRAWAITCLAVAPDRRRAGVARGMLAAVLRELDRLGVERVEAFPRRSEAAPEAGELWTGPEALYRALGFRERGGEATRPVLARERPPG